jgi:NAD(P)-dependent dehydrogenase (short-subunit alcohol dehydrogenase family)
MGAQYTVAITGASRGLGYALVKSFLEEEGCTVLAITRNPRELENLAVAESVGKLVVLKADIGTVEGRSLVYEKVKGLPRLKILIHNAGKLLYKPFEKIKPAELEEVYQVNVFSPFHLTQVLMPLFDNTHTIAISSIGGVEGSLKFPGLTAYSSSKAAINCLVEVWSEEFKDTNNSFNALALGSVSTDMFEEAFPGFEAASTPDVMANYIKSFAFEAPAVLRGKVIPISLSNP